MKRTKKTNTAMIVAVAISAVLVTGYFLSNSAPNKDDAKTVVETKATTSQAVADDTAAAPTSTESSTEDLLLYLIEEEKLAHDVYTVMYQKYGANVFGNILKSEEAHQGRVLTLLEARSIADPRSSELGVFKNKELQTLYDQLIEQGNKNVVEAYKVGVIIEEKDIADISAQLATATDQDVIGTLEALRSGSENHLRAFNRQL